MRNRNHNCSRRQFKASNYHIKTTNKAIENKVNNKKGTNSSFTVVYYIQTTIKLNLTIN